MNGIKKGAAGTRRLIPLPSEPMYLLAIVMIAFAVAMCAAADFGVSMIVAPAYVLSLKFTFLTFGQWEYVLQATLFIAFCILMRKFRPVYLFSFFSCVLYGLVLDFFRTVIPFLNPAVTPPGSMSWPARIALFAGGNLITAVAVAIFTASYLYPQVYDFFVIGLTTRYRLSFTRFKVIYDLSFLAVGIALSLILFHGFNGIGVGTVIIALLNGFVIGLFSKLLRRFFVFKPLFPKVAALFRLDGPPAGGEESRKEQPES